MKKFKYRIPVILIAALAAAAVLFESFLADRDKTANSDIETYSNTSVSSSGTVTLATSGTTDQATGGATDFTSSETSTKAGDEITTRTAIQQDTAADNVTIDGVTVDRKKLIDKLDKKTDETITYVYNQSPENITIGNVYEGDFSSSGKTELLVIFKLLGLPHAGGLDCSVVAVYDRDSYGLISQKTFPYDECRFAILKDSKQKSYLLFVGSTTYQGHSQYNLQLYRPGRTWEKVYSAEPPEISELLDDPDNIKLELRDDGRVWVYRPVSFDAESQQFKWRHVYDLVWNSDTCTLDEDVPKTLKNADGSQNAETVSVSHDGRYVVSTIPEKYKVLLYDTGKNELSGEFEMLAQDYGFLWSPDSSKVCVIRTARVWIESSIIDAESLKSVDITAKELQDAFAGNGFKPGYELNENRPDPYITPVEWSPDSKSILMFYQWTDNKYDRQSGTFVYETGTWKISRITRNTVEPEGGNLPAAKPKGFKW